VAFGAKSPPAHNVRPQHTFLGKAGSTHKTYPQRAHRDSAGEVAVEGIGHVELIGELHLNSHCTVSGIIVTEGL